MSQNKHLQGSHELIITPAKRGDYNALSLAQVLALPLGTAPSFDFTDPYGDFVSLPIPEGSIKAYVEKHHQKFSDPDAHIRIQAKYHPAPGEKTPLPPGLKLEKVEPGQ